MSPNLHLTLCVACVAAGLAASLTLALQGSPAAIWSLAALAYALSALGHWVMLSRDDETTSGRKVWGDAGVAALWPLLDLWLLAWMLLPAPRGEEGR